MNEKCNLVTVLLLCCLIFPGNAQEFNWQDLVNRKQYAAVIAHADSLTLADSSNYEIMNAIGQAYEGMLRYQKAYDYYRLRFFYRTFQTERIGTVYFTATAFPRCIPGFQRGIVFITLTASSFNKGVTPRSTSGLLTEPSRPTINEQITRPCSPLS